jgi:SUKH-4 immunity protein
MLTPAQFVARWQAEVVANDSLPNEARLIVAPRERLALQLPERARNFLTEAGLPKSCAPCLTFDDLAHGLRRIWEVYSPRPEWTAEQREGLESYGMIGCDGNGSPICVDEWDGRVVVVDHELLFDRRYKDRRVMFMNSSVAQLAESLLIVHTLAKQARLDALRQIDPSAVADGAFWSYEATNTPPYDDAKPSNQNAQRKPWWKFW